MNTPKSDADQLVQNLLAEWVDAELPLREMGEALFNWALAIELTRIGPERLTTKLAASIQSIPEVAAKART